MKPVSIGEVSRQTVLFHGFDARTPLSARWQKLARQKIDELDALTKQVGRMKAALELALTCRCLRMEDCDLSAADALDPPGARGKGGCSC